MISAKLFAKHTEKLIADNTPVILTGVGAVGAVASSVLAVKAAWKSNDLLHEENDRRLLMNEKVIQTSDKVEMVKFLWREYALSAGVLTVSVASIICSNRVSTKRAAAMAAAYTISEKAYSEYRDKVAEKFNTNKERQVRDEIAQDRVTNTPPRESQIIITGNGEVTCYDLPTGRYFRSSVEKLRSVQNDINADVNEVGYANLDAFYVALGLAPTPYSDELGWTTDKLFEIQFSAVVTEDSQPCISINYSCSPLRGSSFRQEGCKSDPNF